MIINRKKPFQYEVALGNIEEHYVMNKFGENPNIDTGTDPEDVWDYGGIYTFSTTNDIDTISSSDAGDNMVITIEGLDENCNIVVQNATLNGQNKVTLDTPLMRVYRAYNAGSTDIAGDVYIYVDGAITDGVPNTAADVRAMIRNGNNQTLMCIYTVPAGFTALFTAGYVAFSKAVPTSATADFTWRARPVGGVFQVKSKIGLTTTGSSTWDYTYGIPVALPEKTDILIRCEEVSANNISVSGGFDLMLVPITE